MARYVKTQIIERTAHESGTTQGGRGHAIDADAANHFVRWKRGLRILIELPRRNDSDTYAPLGDPEREVRKHTARG
jgi:hypothetical protein